ncbi:MAG: hypothetical protein ABI789_00030 [Usitatibacter sp.]
MGRGKFIGWLAAGAIAASGIGAAGAREAPGWTLVDLGTLGGPGSYGAAVSDSGVVVGCSDVAAGGIHAFIYHDGAMHDLEPASVGNSCALAVNNAGIAAGRSSTGELVTWSGSAITQLGVHGNVGGINDAGVVVGSFTGGTSTRAFMFANGALVALAGDGSTATAINARGDIVGTDNGSAYLCRAGAMVSLGTLGGNRSDAKGVNIHAQVVGLSTDANGQPLSFLYDGAMRALPVPGNSSAVAINGAGQIVGSAEGTYGYLIDAGNYSRLDTLPSVAAKSWRHLEPTGINDRGWIVGTGTNAEGNLHAFLLVPGNPPIAVAYFARMRDEGGSAR